MKRKSLVVALAVVGISAHVVAHGSKGGSVTFINDSDKRVTLTIYKTKSGKEKTKSLSAKNALWGSLPWIGRSYKYHTKNNENYEVSAASLGLSTGRYTLSHQGTVHIAQEGKLLGSGEKLVLKGSAVASE